MSIDMPIRVLNPATGAVVGEVSERTSDDVQQALLRARAAQPDWAARPFRERARLLRRLASRLLQDGRVVEALIAESGKPRYEAEAVELFYTCELTRYYTGRVARRALREEVRHPLIFANKRARVIRHPHGVVGVIGPWNFPLLNNYADCIGPLVCGNTVVLKPSPVTPMTSLKVLELWREEGLPDDVFQVVPGGAKAGQALVQGADMIFFTGSEATGRKVAAAAGERLIPAVLELGGKNAMLVLRDADLERAARAAVWSGFMNSGQVCQATGRVLVEHPAVERFTELVLAEIGRLRQGVPGAPGHDDVDLGAITFPAQLDRIQAHITDALAGGARLLAGGKRTDSGQGTFFPPTVLRDVTPEMQVMREETFGPVLPIMAVDDAEQALRIANALPYGLTGSVWSRNVQRARDLARRMESGSVCVNDAMFNYFCVEAPLGGVKHSGMGVRHGPEGLRQFCRIETVVEDRPVLGRISGYLAGQLSFPYRRRTLNLLRRAMRLIYG